MLTIAWDIDDVLNNLMYTWLEEWWNPGNRDCLLKYKDLIGNPPHRIPGVSLNEYLQSLNAFRLSGSYERIQPNQKLLEWSQKNGAPFRHIALTSVPRLAAPISASWVFKHFGDWIRSFHFVPSSRPEEIPTPYETTKAGYLKWLNRVNIFIDDHTDNLQNLETIGIRRLLLSRPWNFGGIKIEEILDSLTSAVKVIHH